MRNGLDSLAIGAVVEDVVDGEVVEAAEAGEAAALTLIFSGTTKDQ